MADSIVAYTMGGCRYPCSSIRECSMAGRLSPIMGEGSPVQWDSAVSGPDFSTMVTAYVPKETRKAEVRETVKDEAGKEGERLSLVDREFLLTERAGILSVTRVETDPGSPYCNVAAVLRGDDSRRPRLVQAMKEEGRRLEYTPHDDMADLMVACSVECPGPCLRMGDCGLYKFMDRNIRDIERKMRGRDFTTFSVCEGRSGPGSRVDSRATAYGFNNEGGSTFLSMVKLWGEEKPYCIMMVGLHGRKSEEMMIGTALRGVLDREGERFGARKLT